MSGLIQIFSLNGKAVKTRECGKIIVLLLTQRLQSSRCSYADWMYSYRTHRTFIPNIIVCFFHQFRSTYTQSNITLLTELLQLLIGITTCSTYLSCCSLPVTTKPTQDEWHILEHLYNQMPISNIQQLALLGYNQFCLYSLIILTSQQPSLRTLTPTQTNFLGNG